MAIPPKKNIPPAELDVSLPNIPFWLISGFLILVVVTWLPLVFVGRARVTTSTQPKVHMIQDMDNQPRYGPQAPSPIFADGRSMRPPITGTVAMGQLQEDDHFYRGYWVVVDAASGKREVKYFDGMPGGIEVDEAFIKRGQERFGIYCSVCHGIDGYGNGPVNARATEVQESKWVPPSSLHAGAVRERADGHIYNTINNGIRNMPAYGAQISPRDRWAIVAYVRALQLSQHASVELVPPDDREALR